MVLKESVAKLKHLAESLEKEGSPYAEDLNKVILAMTSQREGASIRIEKILVPAIQDYYQLLIERSQFNKNHWISTLRSHLKNLIKLNDAPKFNDGFFLSNDEIDNIIKKINEDSFINALDHLGYNTLDKSYYRTFYNKELSLLVLYTTADLDYPLYEKDY